MPPTSRSRSTARPATARPSASTGVPAARGERHQKAAAFPRAARSTACSMRCAVAGVEPAAEGEHAFGDRAGDERARYRREFPARRMPPAIPPGPAARDSSSALSRSISARSSPAASRRGALPAAAVRRVRSSTRTPSTPKQMSPRVSARLALSCARRGRRQAALRARRRWLSVGARKTAATRRRGKSPRLGRERSLPFAVRIVSGMQQCPTICARRPPRRPRIVGLYACGDSRRKSPDRERERGFVALFQRLRLARHVLDIDAAKRGREHALGFAERGSHHAVDQRRAGQRRLARPLPPRSPRARYLRR